MSVVEMFHANVLMALEEEESEDKAIKTHCIRITIYSKGKHSPCGGAR